MAEETQARTQEEIDALLSKSQSGSVEGMSFTRRSIADRIALEKHELKKGAHRFGFGRAVMRGPEH